MARLMAAGRREGATLYMVLLAAFQALLGRYSGQTDLAVGTPLAGRPRPELEGLIGFFVNTLVLRADLSANPTVREHLARVREACLGAQAHQDVPFERLVDELRPQRDLSRNPLFQAMFVYEPAPVQPLSFPGLEAQALEPPAGVARFDLTLVVTERAGPERRSRGDRRAGRRAGRGRASLEYRSDLFEAPTVRRMLGHLMTLLQGFVSTPDGRLDDLPLLPPAERRQLLVDWNATQSPYVHDVPFHHLFARHAAEAPHAVAAVFEGQSLTYGALDARANRLAHYLRRLGVGPEVRVALCVERSLDQVVGLLGILKAGGVYVPLDPAYPAARLSYMLEDAGAPVLLTQQRVVEALPPHSGRVVCLDADWATIAAGAGFSIRAHRRPRARGLRDLHLRLHRAPQGGAAGARGAGQPDRRPGGHLRARAGRPGAAVLLPQLRRLRLRDGLGPGRRGRPVPRPQGGPAPRTGPGRPPAPRTGSPSQRSPLPAWRCCRRPACRTCAP